MAVKLNLLPSEYAVGTGLSKALGITRMLGVIGLAAFLIFGIGMGAFFLISSGELNSLKTNNDSLKSQILAEATSEQQLVLLKDRVKKIQTALGLPSSIKNLTSIDSILPTSSESFTLSELSVDTTKIALNATLRSNADLSTFMKSLAGVMDFKFVTLSSFAFNPTSGYSVGVTFGNK